MLRHGHYTVAASVLLIAAAIAVNSINYAGVRLPYETEVFEQIGGSFVVPAVSIPDGAEADGTVYRVAAWVGFDDSVPSQQYYSILQSGCVFATDGNQQVNRCWQEWYPGPQSTVQGFVPSVGDTVNVICTIGDRDDQGQATTGTCTLTNVNTGEQTSVGLTAPDGVTARGSRVEWIVEDPAHQGTYLPYAKYDNIPFSDCVAYVLNGDEENLSYDGTVIFNMAENNGQTPVANTAVQDANDFVVQYVLS